MADIDFWTNPEGYDPNQLEKDMNLKHQTKQYPPRVTMEARIANGDQICAIPVDICGSTRDLSMKIILPLGTCVTNIRNCTVIIAGYIWFSTQSSNLFCNCCICQCYKV